jgi:hypothetical protein
MAVDQEVARARQTNKAAVAEMFPGETRAQIAAHTEIARRHRRSADGKSKSNNFPHLRMKELSRLFAFRYHWDRLPDDDAGRDDLRLFLDHAAQISLHLARQWAMRLLPELDYDDTLDDLLQQVGNGKRWKADNLARAVGLDHATRTRLKIRTIGAIDFDKGKRKALRKSKRRANDRSRRAAAGAKPRAQSAERKRPWEAEGISRRTWYRRRANGTAGTVSRPQGRRPTTATTAIRVKVEAPPSPPSPTPCQANFDQRTPAFEVRPSFPTEKLACVAGRVSGPARAYLDPWTGRATGSRRPDCAPARSKGNLTMTTTPESRNIGDDRVWSRLTHDEKFASGLASLRRMIATTTDDRIEPVFTNIANEIRNYTRRGLDRQAALAELTQIGDAYGPVRVLGADRVERIIAAHIRAQLTPPTETAAARAVGYAQTGSRR